MKNIFRDKITQYSALSVGILAAAKGNANGQIIYHDIDPDIYILSPVYLDINNDGVNDFEFTNEKGDVSLHAFNGNQMFATTTYVAALNPGYVMPTSIYWWSGNRKLFHLNCGQTQTASAHSTICHESGPWKDGPDQYIAIRLNLGDGLHYGWMRLHEGTVLKDYAYESQPNIPILAGQFEGCDTVKARVTTPGPYVNCNNNAVTLNVLGSSPYQITWLENGIAIRAATSNDITVWSGNYNAVVFAGGCADTSATISVKQDVPPVPSISRIADTLYSSIPYGNQWYVNYNLINGATNRTYTMPVGGYYSLFATDTNGCTNINFQQFYAQTCNELLNVQISAADHRDSICTGTTELLTSSDATLDNFQWLLNSQPIPYANSNNYLADASGNYTLAVGGVYECVDTTNSIHLEVYSPNPKIVQSGNILTSNYSSGNQWILNGKLINGATNQQYNAVESGFYQVHVIDQNGCSGISDSLDLIVTGVADNLKDPSVRIFQQNKVINVMLPQNLVGSEILLFDELGVLIKDIPFAKLENSYKTSGLSSGIYFVQLKKDEKIITYKVFIHS